MNPDGQILPLESLRPGMRLAEAIRDRHGNIMLTENTELTDSHLAALRQRGIASAMVLPERIPPSDEDLAAMRQSTEERLRHIFHKTLELPGSRKLFDIILAYRLEKLK